MEPDPHIYDGRVLLYWYGRTRGAARARRMLESSGVAILYARDRVREPEVLYGNARFIGLPEIEVLAKALSREMPHPA